MASSNLTSCEHSLKRVAVTGATGFVGGHLIERLRELGVQVVCTCRPTSNRRSLEEQGYDCRVFDPTDADRWKSVLEGVDVVFHLAASTAAKSTREYYAANTALTRRIGRAAASLPSPPLVVYCSSVAAAGPVPPGQIRLPGTPVAPVSHYGRSKRGGELAVAELAGSVPVTIVRPGIVFGPRNRELYPVFSSIARVRTHVVPGVRCPQLSFIHVADLVEILVRAAVRGSRLPASPAQENGDLDGGLANNEGVYFAGAPEALDYRDFGYAVARAVGWRKHLTLHVPHPVPWVIAAAVETWCRLNDRPAPFQIDKIREASAPCWVCHDPRVTEELQFEFPFPLQERIEQTVAWYRREGWL